MDLKQNPNQEPTCQDGRLPEGGFVPTDPAGYSGSQEAKPGQNAGRRVYGAHRMLKGAAGRAGSDAERVKNDTARNAGERESSNGGDIAAILAEVEAKRRDHTQMHPHVAYSSDSPEASGHTPVNRTEAERPQRQPKTDAQIDRQQRSETSTVSGTAQTDDVVQMPQKAKKKKKHSHFSVKNALLIFLPWKGDSVFEAVRKIIFSTALVVVGVCTFLISSYYIDLYKAKQEYQEIQRQLEEARANRSFQTESMVEDPATGEMFEYLEYNDVANKLLSQNPDLVGYIKVPGTLVSYPVVQKKSKDITVNMNDYYLYRTFHQEESKSGCIFMDYRCHFDEVVEHRRIVDNSGNVFIYGHNMNNRTMFGSLRDYVSNPSFYMEHPLVELSSCYNDYTYKIFAIFIVDGEDYESEYAFDCWNTLEFPDEETFYWYVNEAKKRTTVSTNVDVEYGDPILSLYTCNGLCPNAKLILMCRQLRAGEDPYEGTENATLNENVLYPSAYYNSGHPVNYDPSKFVPYGPKS